MAADGQRGWSRRSVRGVDPDRRRPTRHLRLRRDVRCCSAPRSRLASRSPCSSSKPRPQRPECSDRFGALAAATIERAPRRVWATVMTVLIAVVTTIVITGTNADMIRSARGIFSSVADVDGVGKRRSSRQLSHRRAAARSFRKGGRGAGRSTCHRGRIRVRRGRRHTRACSTGFPPEPPIRSTARSMNGCATRCSPVGAWCSRRIWARLSHVRVGDQLQAANAARPAADDCAGPGAVLLDGHRHRRDQPRSNAGRGSNARQRQHFRSLRPRAWIRIACWPTSAAWCRRRTTYTTVARRWQGSRRRCIRACSSPTPCGSSSCSWLQSHFSTR